MLINGREYSEEQISEMEKLWRKSKQKKPNTEMKIKPEWGDGVYKVSYSDDTSIEIEMKVGDIVPTRKNCTILSVLQKQ